MSADATHLFLEPMDVLFLRGNKLFGEAGSFGESLVPPWPSVAAGALRSRMLADANLDLAGFAKGEAPHPELGTPSQPGSFRITGFQLARKQTNGQIERLVQLPADLVVSKSEDEALQLSRLTPTALTPGLLSSYPLPQHPVLAETTRSKPASGYWLTEAGLVAYLAGETPKAEHLVRTSALWQLDARVGVGLDPDRRAAAEGRLFTVQAVAPHQGVGFLASVSGATPPTSGSVRLGGDGRAAAVSRASCRTLEPDFGALARARRCRLVLASPGLFTDGWRPNGVAPDAQGALRLNLHGVRARLVCAAVPRAETVSGFDIARWQPKPAQKVAPTGSVYWFDELEASPEALRKLVDSGVWSQPCEDAQRRAEGFNRAWLAPWSV